MTVTLTNATLQFAKIGSKTYVRVPLGTTGYTLPFVPPASPFTSTFTGTWVFEYDPNEKIVDSSNPNVEFCAYVGGRPKDR